MQLRVAYPLIKCNLSGEVKSKARLYSPHIINAIDAITQLPKYLIPLCGVCKSNLFTSVIIIRKKMEKIRKDRERPWTEPPSKWKCMSVRGFEAHDGGDGDKWNCQCQLPFVLKWKHSERNKGWRGLGKKKHWNSKFKWHCIHYHYCTLHFSLTQAKPTHPGAFWTLIRILFRSAGSAESKCVRVRNELLGILSEEWKICRRNKNHPTKNDYILVLHSTHIVFNIHKPNRLNWRTQQTVHGLKLEWSSGVEDTKLATGN